MSNLRLQRAEALYREFIDRVSPHQARAVPLSAPDLPTVPTLQVSRQAMLDRFLTENAEYVPYRKELSGIHPELTEFPVAKGAWQEANA